MPEPDPRNVRLVELREQLATYSANFEIGSPAAQNSWRLWNAMSRYMRRCLPWQKI